MRSITAILLSLLLTASFALSLIGLPEPVGSTSDTSRVLVSSHKILQGPTFSPAGDKILFASGISGTLQIWIMDLQGNHQMRLTSLSGNSSSPKFSPDGMNIAFFHSTTTKDEIMVMSYNGSNVRDVSGNDSVDGGIFAWSPDSHWIAYQADSGNKTQVIVRDLATDQIVFRAEGTYPTWSIAGNSKTLAYITNEVNGSTLQLADLNVGTVRSLPMNSVGNYTWPVFVSNNTKVAFLSSSNSTWEIMCLDLNTGQTTNMLESPPGQYDVPVLNPTLGKNSRAVPMPTNSSEVLFAAASSAPRMVDLYVAILGATIMVSHFFNIAYPGTLLDRVTNQSYSSIRDLTLSADGKNIIFVSSTGDSLNSIIMLSYVAPVVQSVYGS
ncbi:MAG: PD40 domain-containing protein [Nitrososphaerota archaeon]|nr:PD40 domain-containing protein [Nitrososphaerota archaeon]MDG6921769.1 PD40 domain-containing protein [Nitrososphaerota archaeon]